MKPIYFFEIFSSESHLELQLCGSPSILSKFPHNDVREHLSSWIFWSFCSMFWPVATLTAAKSPRIFGHFLEHFSRTSNIDHSSWHKNNRFEHQWRCETAVSELTDSILFIADSLWNPNIVSNAGISHWSYDGSEISAARNPDGNISTLTCNLLPNRSEAGCRADVSIERIFFSSE